jgi:UPF0271 protein
MPPVALNIDLGELDREPDDLYAIATAVNIACGGHAGSEASMDRSIALALRARSRIAAHPSYPDRPGFGRRTMQISPRELEVCMITQCGALRKAAERAGAAEIVGLKPHGALYHDTARDPVIAEAVLNGALQGLRRETVEVVGQPGSVMLDIAAKRGMPVAREGSADRAYRPDGMLVPRGERGALIEEPALCAAQAIKFARSGRYETICVHADTPGSLRIAKAVRTALISSRLLEDAAKLQPSVRITLPPGWIPTPT